ncbi:MAG: hypothetical protein IT249_17835 [Chitinophagaceae bacterium]|nr:hypothetical protein [Chitinophagaceae bacterium]
MRISTIVTAILIIHSTCASAQIQNRFPVKSGEIPDQVIPFNVRYIFPEFKEGRATLRSGAISNQKFNYSCLLDEMQFITASGDTLAIAAPAELKSIQVDSTIFYYDRWYLKQIKKQGRYILAVKKSIVQLPGKKEAGYNSYSSTSSITNYSSIISGSKEYKLQANNETVFIPIEYYFLGDDFGRFNRADKRTFLNLFADKKKGVQEYIKQNKINFNNKEDVSALFDFCVEEVKK